MPRTKGGVVARRRRNRVLKAAKGFWGSKHCLYKVANQQVMKGRQYAFRDRKNNKRNFRKLWIVRINAAARMQGLTYSVLMHGLKVANIDINRKMLADLAVNDIAMFNSLCDAAKKALAKGIDAVVFDRGGYLYTGRVAALADGAREAGLKF